MRVYKWEQLKLKACRAIKIRERDVIYGILQQIEQISTSQPIKNWRDNINEFNEFREKAWEIIENWDIRNAGDLFKLFPI